ncbi:DUF1648 domain-containing protein [Nocardioides sp. CER19]|uniref:DUF1648 domain-containing protein n=1 Tax=Nocardioides sp. CER19 TaxID=3038538 RepID=UPI002446BCFC|nr:DUF1648 domain-containing protein [Nocardioides sp. CER19]MDH2414933.1 DUF1648 domain-containing protein [Nocardioides sp. CER19]
MTTRLRALAAATVLAVAPTALLVVWLVVRDDLPARLATHFGLDGTPSAFQPAGVFVGWILPLTAVIAAAGVVVVTRLRAPGTPVLAGVLGYLAWLFAAVGADTLLSARGVADPGDIRSGAGHILALVAVGAAAGLLVWRLTPLGPRPDTTGERPPAVPVAPGERVVWLGSATSTVAGRIAGALALGGIVLLALSWFVPSDAFVLLALVGGTLLLVALAVGWCRCVHVRVDNDGVVARLGGLPWPAFATPMERIEGASVEMIEPLRWGGWGYRLGPRGSAIVVRRGPGIVLRRTGRSDLAITVDDAETAAALVDGLVAVRR